MSASQICLFRKVLLPLLFALICLSIAGLAQSVEQEDKSKQNIEFKDASLKAVLATLGKQLKINVVFDDYVKDNKLTIELKDVTIKAAIKIIFVQQHLKACLIEDKTIIIFPDNETIRRRYYEQYKAWPEEADKKQ
jgi:type II secretory pathway component GspD/PulD (secretin)